MSFVIIEGPNGSGKTSLIKKFNEHGIKTLSSPNGTPLAKHIRSACRGVDEWVGIDKHVKFMLFSAARLDEYIRLVKDSKELVVADRWWTSTYVYQCVLEGFSTDFLEYTIHPQEKVDLVIGLDADDEILFERVRKERELNKTHGNCSWTQDKETMLKIFNIYRFSLPHYLNASRIQYERIYTGNSNVDEVFTLAMSAIRSQGIYDKIV